MCVALFCYFAFEVGFYGVVWFVVVFTLFVLLYLDGVLCFAVKLVLYCWYDSYLYYVLFKVVFSFVNCYLLMLCYLFIVSGFCSV